MTWYKYKNTKINVRYLFPYTKVIFKRLYRHSPTDYGTLHQLRNLINRRNVVKTPKNNFNACDDFFRLIFKCHIITAALKVLQMESCTSPPPHDLCPEIIQLHSAAERKNILHLYYRAIVEAFTNLQLKTNSLQCHEILTYDDKITGYATELLTLGLLYVEFTDAIHEGDGDRILRCWRFMLLLFRISGRTNYSIEAFRMLYSYSFLLSPRQAKQLLWSRCINTSGRPGKNVAMDINMEHLNRTCKDAICGLDANKTPKAITRIGKCIGVLTSVTENFDEQSEITKNKAAHTMSSEKKDRDLVTKELLSHAVFTPVPGRTHSSFSNIDSGIFSKLSYGDITTWMTNHIPT